MIRHVVAFTLAATSDTERAAALSGMQERLSALVGVVPGLQSLSVKPDLGLVEGHWDIVLISDHDDNEALEGYQTHPAHLDAAAFTRSVTADRVAVDFEV
jgi:hypothetical protein